MANNFGRPGGDDGPAVDVNRGEGTFLTEVAAGARAPAIDAPFEDFGDDDMGELEALVAGVTQTTQSTLLLKKRKDMREVDDALMLMKEEFSKRMAKNREQQLELERKQKEKKESVEKFKPFINETETKKKRAEAKFKAEQKAREQYEQSEKEHRAQLEQFVAESRALEIRMKSLLRYQSYLESVIAPGSNDSDFGDISDVLGRYFTLKTANEDLQRHQAKGEEDFDSERSRNAQILEKTQNDILVNNSIIHEKQKLVENLKRRTAQLRAEIESSEHLKKTTKTEYGQVNMSIKNLQNRCATSLQGKKVAQVVAADGESELQYLTKCLQYIASRVNDLRSIVETFKKGNRTLVDTDPME